MSTLTRIALPVPLAGNALDGSGEAYVASLDIMVEGMDAEAHEATIGVATTGDLLEGLLMALRLRHTSFHPRTFAFNGQSVIGTKLADMIDSRWSSVDASGPDVIALARSVLEIARTSEMVRWRQKN